MAEQVAASFSEAAANSFMLALSFAGVAGGLLSGPLLKLCGGRLKALEMGSITMCVLGLGLLTALLPSPWWDGPLFGAAGSSLDGSHSDASSSGSSAGLAAQQPVADLWLLFLMILCVGFASGAMWPPLFEIAAEITFPVSESTSGGFLGLTCNGGGVIFLYLPSIVATH